MLWQTDAMPDMVPAAEGSVHPAWVRVTVNGLPIAPGAVIVIMAMRWADDGLAV